MHEWFGRPEAGSLLPVQQNLNRVGLKKQIKYLCLQAEVSLFLMEPPLL